MGVMPLDKEASIMAKQSHLSLEERYTISYGIEHRHSFSYIGKVLKRDPSTISKEIKKHRGFKKVGTLGHPFNDCLHRHECIASGVCQTCSREQYRFCRYCSQCTSHCELYQRESCKRLEKPPYVCTGCSQRPTCTLEKAEYNPVQADKDYRALLSESRKGPDLTPADRDSLNRTFTPLIQQGQSIHHICANNPDLLTRSERTIYNYVDANVIDAINLDMPRKVRMRPRHKKAGHYYKVDKACRKGREYEDFLKFRTDHPDYPVTEIDSVEGIKGGAVLLTIHLVLPDLQLAFKRECNDAASVNAVFDRLYDALGPDDYKKIFPLILADNGTEFSDPLKIEFDKDGNRRSYLFYCQPNAPYQKPHAEHNHSFIRRFIPKGKDIGKYNPAQIDLMMNHINSYSRPMLGDKSPYEMFEFMYGNDPIKKLGLIKIPANEIILSPKLFTMDTGPTTFPKESTPYS